MQNAQGEDSEAVKRALAEIQKILDEKPPRSRVPRRGTGAPRKEAERELLKVEAKERDTSKS